MTDATRVHQTIAFLRLTSIELRRIARLESRVADAFLHTANQCDREADDLAEHFAAPPPLLQSRPELG
jgi:hypothetical protein